MAQGGGVRAIAHRVRSYKPAMSLRAKRGNPGYLVIASEGRQSRRPLSLRAKRGNPVCEVAQQLDCHVASLLAMTGQGSHREPLSRHCERSAAIQASPVIASEARQSRRPSSLRAERGNPVCGLAQQLDCHVAALLAMTAKRPRRCAPRNDRAGCHREPLSRHCERSVAIQCQPKLSPLKITKLM